MPKTARLLPDYIRFNTLLPKTYWSNARPASQWTLLVALTLNAGAIAEVIKNDQGAKSLAILVLNEKMQTDVGADAFIFSTRKSGFVHGFSSVQSGARGERRQCVVDTGKTRK